VPQFLTGKASLSWIIRRTLLAWLQLISGCFQRKLKGKRFSDAEDIKSSVKKKLTDIPVQDF
jgi:hypothetical protein